MNRYEGTQTEKNLLALEDRVEMPGLETAARDPLGVQPEHMVPEHILMNNLKKLRAQELKNQKGLR